VFAACYALSIAWKCKRPVCGYDKRQRTAGGPIGIQHHATPTVPQQLYRVALVVFDAKLDEKAIADANGGENRLDDAVFAILGIDFFSSTRQIRERH
jgi:hypothetical protein